METHIFIIGHFHIRFSQILLCIQGFTEYL